MKSSRYVAALGLAIALGAQGHTAPLGDPGTPPSQASAPAAASMAEGVVRKVDRAQGKLTLRHGPIASLGMPGMTMVFRVADARLLDGLKEGDSVRFAADRIHGALTVTAIEQAR